MKTTLAKAGNGKAAGVRNRRFPVRRRTRPAAGRAGVAGAVLALALLWAGAAFGWSFGVCGDSRDDVHGIFPRILSAVDESDMEFLIHTGDLEKAAGAASWEAFRGKTAGFSKPLHIAIGNHELRNDRDGGEDFARFFGLPATSYAFTHKDARFVVLDNARGFLPDNVLAWLDRELALHPKGENGIRYVVLAMHYPPRTDNVFPHRTHKRYGEQSIRLLRILSRHKVDLVLTSHEHMHEVDRWDGVTVIVSGGAGAPMYPFQRFGFYRIDLEDGKVRETFIPVK